MKNGESERNRDFRSEVLSTLSNHVVKNVYENFDTSYGPPTTAKLNGNWLIQTLPNQPGNDQTTQFAKHILNQTLTRINERVCQERMRGTLRETEEIETSVLDNSSGRHHLCGIYRWLNKIYKAEVIHYGNRLLLTFHLKEPAGTYLASETDLRGKSLEEPLPLAERNAASFEDLDEKNYPILAADYGVSDLEAYPAPTQTVAVSLQNEVEKQVLLPEGYQADKAQVSCVLPAGDQGTQLSGMVGTQSFNLKAGNLSVADLPMNAEDHSVPVALLKPETPDADFPDYFVVHIEIHCKLSDRRIKQWQIKTYNALSDGYLQCRQAYNEKVGLNGVQEKHLGEAASVRRIEWNELKRGCLRILNHGAVGSDSATPGMPPDLLPFFDQILEWPQMAYSLSMDVDDDRSHWSKAGEGAPNDQRFAHFLQADHARVWTPVEPRQNLIALYFLAAGLVWTGPPEYAPIHESHVNLVNTLCNDQAVAEDPKSNHRSWEISVPTAMQILVDGDASYQFDQPQNQASPKAIGEGS